MPLTEILGALVSRLVEVTTVPPSEQRSTEAWIGDTIRMWLYLAGLGLALVGILVCLLEVTLRVPLPPEMARDRPLVMGLILALALIGAAGVAVLLVVVNLVRRQQQLDAVFVPLGLRGRRYLLNGRHYCGTVQGRQVDVWFDNKEVLEVYMSASVRTRLMVAAPPSASQAPAREALSPSSPAQNGPEPGELQVIAVDEPWARDLLTEPRAAAAIWRLVASRSEGGHVEQRQFRIQPGAICLRLHGMPAPQWRVAAQAWLADLIAVAQVAEALPPPAEPLAATQEEEDDRTRRRGVAVPAMTATCGWVAFAGVCLAAILALLFLSAGH